MSGFGKWYEEKKNEELGDNNSGGGNNWLGGMVAGTAMDQVLPLFNPDNFSGALQPISWEAMKSTMEQQMPKKILGMNYQQRFQVFCALLFLSALFFALAFFIGLPIITVRPHKFALSFTMGSFTFMGSFGLLKGPVDHCRSMIQADRILFTTIYIGSMIMTLYCTFSFGGLTGYTMVLSMSAIQLIALLWYLVSFMPGGAAGLRYVAMAMLHLLKPVIAACAQFQAICCSRCLGWLAHRATSSSSS